MIRRLDVGLLTTNCFEEGNGGFVGVKRPAAYAYPAFGELPVSQTQTAHSLVK
jgi:hypothetical protein